MKKYMVQNALFICSVMIAGYACSSAPNTVTTDERKSDETKQDIKQTKQVESDVKQAMNIEQKAAQTNTTAQQVTQVSATGQQATQTEATEQKAMQTNVASVKSANVNPNRFNRLLERRSMVNRDLHDPDNPLLVYLQKPSEAFRDLPKAKTGNKVDWVKAIDAGKIKPRHDILDPSVQPMVMDLNIVMQVKGSMPDVVFPHKAHTRWLDCSNCHPAIFIPQSGANKMSMADNLLGKRCGVCHGKVAFPLSSCTKCHSNKKVVVKEKK